MSRGRERDSWCPPQVPPTLVVAQALWQSEMETRTIENQRRPDEINPASLEMPPGIAASKSWEGPPSGLAGIEDASPRSWG